MWENSEQVLEFTKKCFNFQLESKKLFGIQECHFSSLRSPNFDRIRATRVSKSIYFFRQRQWPSCFKNMFHFLWRGAPQNVKVGKYENLGQFFMLIFKNRTAPDDPTEMADLLWYLARVIKSYFQDGWTIAYHEKCIFFTSLKYW